MLVEFVSVLQSGKNLFHIVSLNLLGEVLRLAHTAPGPCEPQVTHLGLYSEVNHAHDQGNPFSACACVSQFFKPSSVAVLGRRVGESVHESINRRCKEFQAS